MVSPQDNWHAIQMELAQSTYLSRETAPWTYDVIKAEKLRVHLTNNFSNAGRLGPSPWEKNMTNRTAGPRHAMYILQQEPGSLLKVG